MKTQQDVMLLDRERFNYKNKWIEAQHFNDNTDIIVSHLPKYFFSGNGNSMPEIWRHLCNSTKSLYLKSNQSINSFDQIWSEKSFLPSG